MVNGHTNGSSPDGNGVVMNGFISDLMENELGVTGLTPAQSAADTEWQTQAESNAFGPWVEYMRDSSGPSLAGFLSWVRSSKLTEDQRKLSLKKERAGDIQQRAACNNRIERMLSLARQVKILTDYQNDDRVPDALAPNALAYNEHEIAIVTEIQSLRTIIGSNKTNAIRKIVKRRIIHINEEMYEIAMGIQRDIRRGVFRDYGELNKLTGQSGRRMISGGEVARALQMMPDQHRENYQMGMSTQSNTELQHLQTLIIKQPVNAVTNAAKHLMNRSRRGGRNGPVQPRSREFVDGGY